MNRNLAKLWPGVLLLLFSITALAQDAVTGKVIDAKSKEALPGATVKLSTSASGVSTDENGNFRLEVAQKSGVLVVSYIGYDVKELPLNPNSNNLTVELQPSNASLDEVVVVGYGTQSKRKVTGAVSSLDMSVQENSPSVNAGQALRGRVAGVQILDNGRPGQDPSILIRGQRSLSANNAPLIVLDGIIFGGSLSDINPNDILSMDVLKDASAASIYGSRAANGVILITSKRADKEGVVVSFNTSVSTYAWGKKIETFGPERYLQSKLDYRTQSGLEADPAKLTTYLYRTEADNYQKGLITDPYDQVSQSAGLFNYDLNLAGRSAKTNYFLSSSFSKEAGLLVNDNFKRQTFRMNLETEVNSFIKVGMTSTYGKRDMSGVAAAVGSLYTASPYGTWRQPNGDPTRYIVEEDQVSSNPLYNSLMTTNEEIYNNLLSNFYTVIEVPKVEGLSFRVNFSPNVRWNHNYNFFKQDQYLANNTTYANKLNRNGFDWVLENIVKYNKSFKKHTFDVTALFGKNYMQQEQTYANASQLSSDALGYNDLSLGTILTNSSSAYEIRGISSMARLNYDYAGKYMVTLTTRRDGSSVFAANNKYAIFPSVALGWNMVSEDFMQNQDLFNNLKVRLSYGSVGNQGIDPYQSLSLSSITQYVYGNGGSMSIGAFPSIMGNDNLRWETTYSTNLGIDFGILSNRISGTVELYNTRTKDLLVRRSIPAMNGYLNVLTNIGEVQNRGIEITLNSTNVQSNKFSWNTGFNFTFNQNEITKLYGQDLDNDGVEDDDISNRWFIGQPITSYYDYVFDGIYQQGDNLPTGYRPGYVKLKDLNQDGKIDANDRTIIGSGGQPRFKFGLSNDFHFGNLTVSTFINAMTGWMSNFPLLNTAVSPNAPGRGLNQLDAGYWTSENASNTRPSLLYNNPQGHGWYVSRNFVRLQDVSVSYQVPASILDRVKLKSVRVFANAKNLITISDWPGTDPEIGGTGSGDLYSLPRIYNMGLGFSF
jgi:TonB-linked SusC/RagA family outer membrane protein